MIHPCNRQGALLGMENHAPVMQPLAAQFDQYAMSHKHKIKNKNGES